MLRLHVCRCIGTDERYAILRESIHDAVHQFRAGTDGRSVFILIAQHPRPVSVCQLAHAGAYAHALRTSGEHILNQVFYFVRAECFKRKSTAVFCAILRADLSVVKIADAVGFSPKFPAELIEYASERFAAFFCFINALLKRFDFLFLPSAVRAADWAAGLADGIGPQAS